MALFSRSPDIDEEAVRAFYDQKGSECFQLPLLLERLYPFLKGELASVRVLLDKWSQGEQAALLEAQKRWKTLYDYMLSIAGPPSSTFQKWRLQCIEGDPTPLSKDFTSAVRVFFKGVEPLTMAFGFKPPPFSGEEGDSENKRDDYNVLLRMGDPPLPISQIPGPVSRSVLLSALHAMKKKYDVRFTYEDKESQDELGGPLFLIDWIAYDNERHVDRFLIAQLYQAYVQLLAYEIGIAQKSKEEEENSRQAAVKGQPIAADEEGDDEASQEAADEASQEAAAASGRPIAAPSA